MISLVVLSLIIFPVFKMISLTGNFGQKIFSKLELNQQARIISYFLENDIKNAVDFKIKGINTGGNFELYLNLGENSKRKDGTGPETNYYICYQIIEGKLYMKTISSSLKKSGMKKPIWPGENDWGYKRPLTVSLIKKHSFRVIDQNKITYYFELKNKNNMLFLKNSIVPRSLWIKKIKENKRL